MFARLNQILLKSGSMLKSLISGQSSQSLIKSYSSSSPLYCLFHSIPEVCQINDHSIHFHPCRKFFYSTTTTAKMVINSTINQKASNEHTSSSFPTKHEQVFDSISSLINLNFRLTPEQIKHGAHSLINQIDAFFNSLLQVSPRTPLTILLPWARAEAKWETMQNSLTFPQYVSTDETTREASVEANKLLDQHAIELSTRQDLYELAKSIQDNEIDDPELSRFAKKLMLDFKHSGMELDDQKRTELKALRQELAKLAVDFSNVMNSDKTVMLVTREELQGCNDDYLESLEVRKDALGTGLDLYVVTLKYPDIHGIMSYAEKEDVRRKLALINETSCQGNEIRLQRAVELRNKAAQLLGYPDHAHFRLADRMAKSPKQVLDFLNDLRAKLEPHGKSELEILARLKAKSSSAQFRSWDYALYTRILEETEYKVNDALIKEYFPLEYVIKTMLRLYEEILGVKFESIQTIPGAFNWHQEVQLYAVHDHNQQLKSQPSIIGYFFLDLHPRDGKYTHAACFPLQPGAETVDSDTDRLIPVAAMVANFSKSTSTKPSLLRHSEVETMFHELGHVMHHMCTKARFARFSGTSVERDFVEAPSQMLENWVWEPKVLGMLSKHYQTGASLPQEHIDSLIASKNLNAGLLNLRQLFFGIFDMIIHSADYDPSTLNKTYLKLREEIGLMKPTESTWAVARFGHLMGGYDAGYYGYMWSHVFSADMYWTKFKQDPMNKQAGQAYRDSILGPGGSRDGMDSLVEFLGRQPIQEPFLKSIGLL